MTIHVSKIVIDMCKLKLRSTKNLILIDRRMFLFFNTIFIAILSVSAPRMDPKDDTVVGEPGNG